MPRELRRILTPALIASLLLLGGCAGLHKHPDTSLSSPDSSDPDAISPSLPTAASSRSAVEATIHDARALYQLGLAHYQRGEMDEARAEFDQAVEKLTSGPLGAREDPRLADAYSDILLDIQNLETASYKDGSGLSAASEPPPIDELDQIEPELSPADLANDRQLAEDAGITSDPPIIFNERVLAWIEIYRGTLRSRFQEALVRSGRYIEMVRRVFREEGIPEDLCYMAHVESAWNPYAYSRARAKGLWQFIVGTGTRYGLRRDWWIDERSDPELSTRAAAAYLKDLYAMFGDWYLAMAAYNAGEGKIQRVTERTGLHDFWAIARTSQIRLETKNYVPAILAAMAISKAPARFGFSAERENPVSYDGVAIDSATDLRVVARLSGASVDELQRLNPALTRLQTPPNYPDFELRLPTGSGEAFASSFSQLARSERIPWKSHTVARGETLAAISKRYGVSMGGLRQANGLTKAARLNAGTVLQIPTYTAPSSGHHGDITRAASSRGPSSRTTYRVRRGDTLASIASRFRTSVDSIRSWNHLRPDCVIHAGDRLIVTAAANRGVGPSPTVAGPAAASLGVAPEKASPVRGLSQASVASAGPESTTPAKTANRSDHQTTYQVRRGDTLYSIATRLSTSVENLCRLNRISTSDTLLPGTVLRTRP